MTIKKEINGLSANMFWSGGLDWFKEFTHEELDTIYHGIEETFPEGMTETELNDLFWFEPDMLAEWVGLDSAEALCTRDEPDALKHLFA